jgi:ribosomal protein S7
MKKQQINLKNKMYNHLMMNGNKNTCEKKILKNFKLLQKTTRKSHTSLMKLAILNSSPIIQLRQIKKKKRKSIKEFPYVLNKKNRISLGIKQIVRKTNKILYQEILLVSKKRSEILKTKETKHKLALAQKKYVFFRWFF